MMVGRRKSKKTSKKTLLQCYFVRYRSHVKSGIEPEALR
jgi:hypothetical protein